MIPITSEQQFKDIVDSLNQMSIVYVGREGCGGCVQFHPTMIEYASEHVSDITPVPTVYYYLNTMQDYIRSYLGGRSLPTTGVPSLVAYYGGKIYRTHTGSISKEAVHELCAQWIREIYELP